MMSKEGMKFSVTAMEENIDDEHCVAHLDEKAEYWCREDSVLVCKECLIFGGHKGHLAVKGEEMRSAVKLHRYDKMLARVEEEVGRAQEAAKVFVNESKELFIKTKEEIEQLLDAKYEIEKSRVTLFLSTHVMKLKNTIYILKSGEHVNPEEVDILISRTMKVQMTPSSVSWQGTEVIIAPPVIIVTDERSEGYRHTLIVADDGDTNINIISTRDIDTMDGTMVTVVENGTPGQFYCKVVDCDDMEEMLADAEDVEVSPSPGQGVLVRLEGVWCRATLIEYDGLGWRSELVDMGQVIQGVQVVDMTNLPHRVVDIPALTVKCSLTGVEGRNCWSKEAIKDWEWMVSGRHVKMTVVDAATNTVDISEEDIQLVARLVFLGHVPAATALSPTQHYQAAGPLASAATLCCDYQQISPTSLLLYFDNPLHVEHLTKLDGLTDHPALVGPPGHVQQGSAVLAPWQGSLYRAKVLSVTDTTRLTVLYVDHGNRDMVSWWDCYAVPRDFLFPPLATQVRMAGVRPIGGEKGWSEGGRRMLHQVLDETEKIEVKNVESKTDKNVELWIERGSYRVNVSEFLVVSGYAEWKDGVSKDVVNKNTDTWQTNYEEVKSEKSSNASSGMVMSSFIVGGEGSAYTVENPVLVSDHKVPCKVQEEYMMATDAKVILLGKIEKHASRPRITSVAKQLWDGVSFVMVFTNQIIVTFDGIPSAEKCLESKRKFVFHGSEFQACPNSVCHTTGLFVTGLPPRTRKTELMDHFSKFEEKILFIKGPFESDKSVAVIVFESKAAMTEAQASVSKEFHGNTIRVKINGASKKPRVGELKISVKDKEVSQQKIVVHSEEEMYGRIEDQVTRVEYLQALEHNKIDKLKSVKGIELISPLGVQREKSNCRAVPEMDSWVEVQVTHVESPDEVYVRDAVETDRWSSFYRKLQEAGMEEDAQECSLAPEEKVLCCVESVWHRGTILDAAGRACLVKLVDVGSVLAVDVVDLKKVHDESILVEKLFVKAVKLAGIEPAGSGGWSASSADMLRSIAKKKVFIVVKADQSEDLCVEDVIPGNPFDVGEVVRRSMADILLEEGLALKKNTRRKCSGNWGSVRSFSAQFVIETPKIEMEATMAIVSSSNTHPSSTFFPFLPTRQVFTAMFTNIDSNAVVWIIPETFGHLLSEIIAELGNCVDGVEDVSPGVMVVARNNGRKVRGRVLEEDGNVVKIVDVDCGEVFISDMEDLRQVTTSLLSKPPLAIPLKLYGVKKSSSTLSDADRAAVFDKMGKTTSSLFWVTVSIMERNMEQLPLPANVRYTVVEQLDRNLALDLVEFSLCDVITNFSQWSEEMSDHCLDWMLDPMAGTHSLSFLPHPLPLAVGQWLAVSVEGLEYPLEGEEERDPDITTPDANRIGVQVMHLSRESVFDQYQEDIGQSLAVVGPQVSKLSTSSLAAKVSLALCASMAEKVASPTVGQSVLVFYEFTGEGGEWCRGTVETLQRNRRATVHYTDYGHRGQVEVRKMRSIGYEERMMPVQVREVMFRMPESNVELAAIRLDLRQEEKKLMRVEQITPRGHPMELEEIMVSVWRVVEEEGEERFLLSRIC